MTDILDKVAYIRLSMLERVWLTLCAVRGYVDKEGTEVDGLLEHCGMAGEVSEIAATTAGSSDWQV